MDQTSEISLQYVEEIKPITEYYIHSEPLPERATPHYRRKKASKLPKWVIPLAIVLCILGIAGRIALQHFALDFLYYDFPFFAEEEDTQPEEPAEMPRYEKQGDFRLCYETKCGDEPMSAQEIYATVNPAVVTIVVSTPSGDYSGTGIILSQDGYILTNEHVMENAVSCTVILDTADMFEAQLVGTDVSHDIAVIKVNATGLPTAVFGDSDNLWVGDSVYAIGNPLGLELRGTMTDGIISAISRSLEMSDGEMTVIQTNAALNSGNSGGPLINAYGQVIGINTLKMGNSRVTNTSVEGLGFAIPISEVTYLINDIIRSGEAQGEGLLGLSAYTEAVALPDSSGSGLLVAEVTKGSAAEKAGICQGDYLLQGSGRELTSVYDLLAVRRACCIGETLTLRVWHEGAVRDVNVTLQ